MRFFIFTKINMTMTVLSMTSCGLVGREPHFERICFPPEDGDSTFLLFPSVSDTWHYILEDYNLHYICFRF